ncbi:MOSC domain-containing protein [Micromonospora zhanjiangensis]|uniref:MOSC domain-containing protein n=1 Tax=Micromonospora zhanjiangensis TaxID=1522057 RepID=A0ABV8KMI5_9ACTN
MVGAAAAGLDAADGTVGSAKLPRRWGRLLDVPARYVEGAGDPAVTLELDGRTFTAGSAATDAALGAHLDHPVRLTRVAPPDARLHRLLPDEPGLVPQWMAGIDPGTETVTPVAGARSGRFVDFGAVHLVTTGALAELADRIGRTEVSPDRFRPNLVLDADRDPEPGARLRFGEVVLRVLVRTPRCVVPGLAQGTLPADRALLATLARDYRTDLPDLGRAACFGSYAEVLRPGRLRVGERAASS